MNFIYSFIEKPKHIFLVHGEEESQDVLKEKIEKEAQIPVIIPEFGDTYELNEELTLTHTVNKKAHIPVGIKNELINRLEKLKDEIKDMDLAVREDIQNPGLKDEDMFRINEKMKELEKNILNVIEG